MLGGFSIFTLFPRSRVTLVSTIEQICSSTALVVEDDEAAVDPLEYLVEDLAEVHTVNSGRGTLTTSGSDCTMNIAVPSPDKLPSRDKLYQALH